jgi:hypothetical protein
LCLRFHHLDHVAARFGAIAARFGAIGHMLVSLEALARVGTLVAAVRTTFAGMSCQSTFAARQCCRQPASLAAIHAQFHGLDVIFVATGHQMSAMMVTGITLPRTLGAYLGARLKVSGMMIAGFVGAAGSLWFGAGRRHQEHCNQADQLNVLHGIFPFFQRFLFCLLTCNWHAKITAQFEKINGTQNATFEAPRDFQRRRV